MLHLIIPEQEYLDEAKSEFIKSKRYELTLEHSLISLSKWEAKWKVPFLGKKDRTIEETIDYIRCMTIGPSDPEAYRWLTRDNLIEVGNYINDPATATWVNEKEDKLKCRKKPITSEIIYYWMIQYGIPFEPCEKWHLNRLLMLIKVCEIKNQPPKQMSKKDLYKRNRSLNEARRAALGTRG